MSNALKKHESITRADETLTDIEADAYRLTSHEHTPEGGFAQMIMQSFRMNPYSGLSRSSIVGVICAVYGYDAEEMTPAITKELNKLVRRSLLRSCTYRGQRVYELAY